MGKRQLLTAQFNQLLAHPQVGNTQLGQIARHQDQRQIFRLVTQEKAHCIVDHRIGDEVVIIDDQPQRLLPLHQLDKSCENRALRLTYCRFCASCSLRGQPPWVACCRAAIR